MDAASQTEVPLEAAPPPTGVFDELAAVAASARDALAQLLELVTLEGRRAALSLAWMLAGGLVAAIFVVTAWAALMAALAIHLVSLGMNPVATAMAVAAINLAAGAGLALRCIALSRDLLFPATRRQLARPPADKSPEPA